MNSIQERLQFSERLRKSLLHADYSPDSPTQLAREFNIRFAGHSVTVHAARKWLQGESIPTQEKLRALANWLQVPADWLRFGSLENATENTNANAQVSPLTQRDAKMVANLQQLDEHHRLIAYDFLRMLLRLGRKK